MSDQTQKQGTFCWNELMTGDAVACKAFYKELWGWETTEMEVVEGMKYTVFQQGDQPVGGMMQIPEDTAGEIPPHWLSYVAVDDVDAMLAKAEKLGATIQVPAKSIPGVGRLGVIIDPTGAHIAMWKSEK